jgi:transposase
MRKGMTGLAMLVQQNLGEDPLGGAVFAFRGRRAGLIKLIWHDGIGLCMLAKRLEQGQLAWPSATTTGGIALSAPQLAALLDGCEWRASARPRRPDWLAETIARHAINARYDARSRFTIGVVQIDPNNLPDDPARIRSISARSRRLSL